MSKIRVIAYKGEVIIDIIEVDQPFRKDGELRAFVSGFITKAIKEFNTIKIEVIGEGK